MPEKSEPEKETAIKKQTEDEPKTGEESTWSEDQQKKSYYYDDSYGYEIYNPDEEE